METAEAAAIGKRNCLVSVYVDGFNLYFGLRDARFRRFLWLDIHQLAQSFLLDNQSLVAVKYFTARISGPPDKRKRQATYLDALAARGDVQIFEGQFLQKDVACKKCSSTWKIYEEKMTDVNIATEMLMDGFAGTFDRAILVSADSDLVPPVHALKSPILDRQVIVAFPPKRNSISLKKAADGFFQINSSRLAKCQLPEQIVKEDGFVLQRPDSWK